PHTLGRPPPPHVEGVAHVLPQSRLPPHPSATIPHCAPRPVHVLRVHGPVPQRFGPPPPQTSGETHALQSRFPPQPSGILPQSAFNDAHVAGTHAHLFWVPPPPHVVAAWGQTPQSRK